MTETWQSGYAVFKQRELRDNRYVYVWADGVRFNVRLEGDRLCTLGVIGARADDRRLLMAHKLLPMAQQRWRLLNAPHLLPLVQRGTIL